ncbi:MAG: HlyD family efflux transporter periplasmic adaptor subunit [Chloracidobacterium sp.]|nr:HlyD family efflux transporter periplasmic adaptor subunit [Chloracidobacterium sp.]
MQIGRKRLIYIGAAIVALGLLLWSVFRESPVSVEAGVVKRSPMAVTIDAEGRTRVRDKVTVTAPISGLMARIRLTEGDNIVRNFPLAEIDPNPPIQRTTPTEPRSMPNPYAAKVFAPIGGKVLRVFDKSERFVAAGAPILELGNPENIEIVVDILSTDAVMVRPGAVMVIQNEHEVSPIRAHVRLVESQAITKVSALGVEEQRVNVIGDLDSKYSHYGDNFRVDVRIMVWEADEVLTIPSSALFRSGENWDVFVIEKGKARRRSVTIGHQNPESTEVLGGLSEGDTVILFPSSQLSDGTKVEAR